MDFPTDSSSGEMYDIFALGITNVFVCTAADGVDLSTNLTQQDGTGGCLSSEIDPDGPYNVIINGIEMDDYDAEIIDYPEEPNKVRFSFLTLATPRTTIYVHVQVEMTLADSDAERRRLQEEDEELMGMQYRHFIARANVVEAAEEEEGVIDETNAASRMMVTSIPIIAFFIVMG